MASSIELTSFSSETSTKTVRLYQAKDGRAPLFLILPALDVRLPFYHTVARKLFAFGYHVALLDWRGGDPPNRANDFGYHGVVSGDIPAAVEKIRKNLPDAPLFLMGHSIGGHFANLYAASVSKGLRGVVNIAGGSPYPAGGSRRLRYWRKIQFSMINIACHAVGYYPGVKSGFGGDQPSRLMRELAYEGRTGRLAPHLNRVYGKQLRKVKTPFLLLSFDEDHLVNKGQMDHWQARLSQAAVTRVHLKGGDPERSHHHIKWIKDPDTVLSRIHNWMQVVN